MRTSTGFCSCPRKNTLMCKLASLQLERGMTVHTGLGGSASPLSRRILFVAGRQTVSGCELSPKGPLCNTSSCAWCYTAGACMCCCVSVCRQFSESGRGCRHAFEKGQGILTLQIGVYVLHIQLQSSLQTHAHVEKGVCKQTKHGLKWKALHFELRVGLPAGANAGGSEERS